MSPIRDITLIEIPMAIRARSEAAMSIITSDRITKGWTRDSNCEARIR